MPLNIILSFDNFSFKKYPNTIVETNINASTNNIAAPFSSAQFLKIFKTGVLIPERFKKNPNERSCIKPTIITRIIWMSQ